MDNLNPFDRFLHGILWFLLITIVPTVVMSAAAAFFSMIGPDAPEGEPQRWYDIAYGVFAFICVAVLTLVTTFALTRWMRKDKSIM